MKKIFLLYFLLSTFNFQLSTVFCQEPIILPPVTITGEDKSVDVFKRFQKQPRVIMGELPKTSSAKREKYSSFFSLNFTAGGYDYIDWKLAGGGKLVKNDEQNDIITCFALVDKLRIGPHGNSGRLNEYNVDSFNFDFSFPFFGNTNLLSSLKYQERNQLFTHPSVSLVSGDTSNIVNHRTKDAEVGFGWKGKIGGLVCLSVLPYYSYTGINDERINADTQAALNQEINAGLKINVQAEMKNLSLTGDLQVEGNQRRELNKSGTNLLVYVGSKFTIPKIPHLNLGVGLQYINPYLFSVHFNPSALAEYRFENGLLFRTMFKGETKIPTYEMFTGNYARFNPLLKEEQDWIFTLEAEKEFGKHGTSAVAGTDRLRGDGGLKFFHSGVENLISSGNKKNLWQPFNIAGFTTIFGAELSADIRYSIGKGNVYGKVNYINQLTIPDSIPYVPKHKILANIGYEIGSIKIEISGGYFNSCWTDTQATPALAISDYFLAGFNISARITEKVLVFFNGENLFDVQYYVLDNYPVAGRNFKGGLEIKF